MVNRLITPCLAASLALAAAQLSAAPVACPVPQAVAPGGESALASKFGRSTAAFRVAAANVRQAFGRACASKLRLQSIFPKIRGADRRRLHFQNWPEANEFVLEADQRRDGTWRLMLSGPFVGGGGTVTVPSSAAIEEAIKCAAGVVSKKEQAESGRCLVD